MDPGSFMNIARQSAQRWGRPLQASPHVRIQGLPRTALPADLRRLCAKHKVENTQNFQLQYNRFRPTGTGYITFTRPDFTPSALRALQNTVVGGSRISVSTATQKETMNGFGWNQSRTRGRAGKAEAVERGLFTGDGPSAGLTGNGMNVLVTGLPGKSIPEYIKMWATMSGFKLAGYEDKGDVIKVDIPNTKWAISAAFVIRLVSVSEAHRLVRKVHMSFFRPDLFMQKYYLKAHVIY